MGLGSQSLACVMGHRSGFSHKSPQGLTKMPDKVRAEPSLPHPNEVLVIDRHVVSAFSGAEIQFWEDFPGNENGAMEMVLFRTPTWTSDDRGILNGLDEHPQLINSFGSDGPILLNQETLSCERKFRLCPTILLDSNAVSSMSKVYDAFSSGRALNANLLETVDRVVAARFELSVDFYCYETFASNGASEEVVSNLRGPVSKVFEISNCDRDQFLSHHQLISHPEAKEKALGKEGVDSFDGLAKVHIKMLQERWENGLKDVFSRTQLASGLLLMKAVHLKECAPSGLEEMIQRYLSFEEECFGISFLRERVFALLYLSGRSQPARDFIRQGLKGMGLRSKLRNSARDLFLPRFGEMIFKTHLRDEEFHIPYIFTHDQAFLEISSPLRTRAFFRRGGDTAWCAYMDPDFLEVALSRNVSIEMMELMLATRPIRRRRDNPPSEKHLMELLQRLEPEVAAAMGVKN